MFLELLKDHIYKTFYEDCNCFFQFLLYFLLYENVVNSFILKFWPKIEIE